MDRLVYAPSVIVLVRQIMTIATYYDYERTTVLAQNQAYVPQASDNAPIDALEAFLSFFHSSHPPPPPSPHTQTPTPFPKTETPPLLEFSRLTVLPARAPLKARRKEAWPLKPLPSRPLYCSSKFSLGSSL